MKRNTLYSAAVGRCLISLPPTQRHAGGSNSSLNHCRIRPGLEEVKAPRTYAYDDSRCLTVAGSRNLPPHPPNPTSCESTRISLSTPVRGWRGRAPRQPGQVRKEAAVTSPAWVVVQPLTQSERVSDTPFEIHFEPHFDRRASMETVAQ